MKNNKKKMPNNFATIVEPWKKIKYKMCSDGS